MLAKARQNEIMKHLTEYKIVKITDIVKRFEVSHETVRRDLEALQEQNLIRRVYGGAILIENEEETTKNALPTLPVGTGYMERAAIGKKAAQLIHEGETILLAFGSTILETAKNIKNMRHITVLTNSISVLNELVNSNVEVYILGGHVNADEQTIGGQMACNALKNIFVDKAFISADGITLNGGISNYSSEESQLINAMIERANQTILVAHSSKFGINSFSVACPLQRADIVVSDNYLSQEYQQEIQKMGISLILADVIQNTEQKEKSEKMEENS